jgi:Signal recognition particle 9 kDa protein (SRP9)
LGSNYIKEAQDQHRIKQRILVKEQNSHLLKPPFCKMPYLPNVNSYLHQSSLLLQAYPTTTRITTKYSLPQKKKTEPVREGSEAQPATSSHAAESRKVTREQQPPAATLTFKTFETTAGICLKYETNKSAEVGRLMTGLGRLAKGEMIEEPIVTISGAEAKESNAEHSTEIDIQAPKPEKVPEAAGGGGKAKKKKGKK